MLYKDYGATGKQLSAIGFGGMRLPDPRRHAEGIAVLHAARLERKHHVQNMDGRFHEAGALAAAE